LPLNFCANIEPNLESGFDFADNTYESAA